MEEVLEQLSGAHLSEPAPVSGYDALFKNRGRLGSQDERRRWLLDSQKRQRNDKLDHTRGILELVDAVEMEMEWSGVDSEVRYRPSRYVAGFHRQAPSYRNTLMLSEWLLEKPEDLSESWYLVPCPKGTRVLLVATSGRTKCFSKYGQFLFEGRSWLPGGNPNVKGSNRCCVLDCVWQKEKNTFHVLDLLAWNNQPMTDCELEFRHFWLTGKLAECPALRVVNKMNHFMFSLLPKVPCTSDLLSEFMMRHPAFPDNSPALDGLLFYHKEGHYASGSTPLVGWLFPYMVDEVLGEDIAVHPSYKALAPADYAGQADYVAKFEAKQSKKGRRSRLNSTSSTVSTPSEREKIADDKSSTQTAARTGVSMEEETSNGSESQPSEHTMEEGTSQEEFIPEEAVPKDTGSKVVSVDAKEGSGDSKEVPKDTIEALDDTKESVDDSPSQEMRRVVDSVVGPEEMN